MNNLHIRVGGVPEHFNTPWYLLNDSQALTKDGIQLDFIPQPGGTGQMAAALRNDELDMAVLLTEGITANILKGDRIKLVSFYVNSPLRWGFHVPASSNFNDVTNLTDKRFAISRPYSGSHLMAHVHAQKHQISLSDNQFVVVKDLEGARQALLNGEADYFLWEKYTTQPLVDAGDFRRIGEVPTPWPCFVVAVREEFLSKYEDVVAQLLESVNHIQRELEANTHQTVYGISKRFKLNPTEVEAWFNELEWSASSNMSSDTFDFVTQTLLKVGVIEERHIQSPSSYLHPLRRIQNA